MPETTPLVHTMRFDADPVATVGNDGISEGGAAPWAGTVTAVRYMTPSAITGANTNSRTVTVTNRGSGAGSTNVATLAFVSGVNTVAHTPKAIPLSGTPANLVVAAGDQLTFDSTHVGTGIADPGGWVEIDITRA